MIEELKSIKKKKKIKIHHCWVFSGSKEKIYFHCRRNFFYRFTQNTFSEATKFHGLLRKPKNSDNVPLLEKFAT